MPTTLPLPSKPACRDEVDDRQIAEGQAELITALTDRLRRLRAQIQQRLARP